MDSRVGGGKQAEVAGDVEAVQTPINNRLGARVDRRVPPASAILPLSTTTTSPVPLAFLPVAVGAARRTPCIAKYPWSGVPSRNVRVRPFSPQTTVQPALTKWSSTPQRRLPSVASRWIRAFPIPINEALSRLPLTCSWFVVRGLASTIANAGLWCKVSATTQETSPRFTSRGYSSTRHATDSPRGGISMSYRTRSTSLPPNSSHNPQVRLFFAVLSSSFSSTSPRLSGLTKTSNYARAVTRTTFVRTSTSFAPRVT